MEEMLYDSIIDNDTKKEEKTIVYNEDKSETYYLEDLDLNKGKLEIRTEVIHHEVATDIRLREIEEELKSFKEMLANTDYKAIKYAEGWYTEEAYLPIKEEREYWRNNIRKLEKEQALLNGEETTEKEIIENYTNPEGGQVVETEA